MEIRYTCTTYRIKLTSYTCFYLGYMSINPRIGQMWTAQLPVTSLTCSTRFVVINQRGSAGGGGGEGSIDQEAPDGGPPPRQIEPVLLTWPSLDEPELRKACIRHCWTNCICVPGTVCQLKTNFSSLHIIIYLISQLRPDFL